MPPRPASRDALVEADRRGQSGRPSRAWAARSSGSNGCSRQSRPNRSSSAEVVGVRLAGRSRWRRPGGARPGTALGHRRRRARRPSPGRSSPSPGRTPRRPGTSTSATSASAEPDRPTTAPSATDRPSTPSSSASDAGPPGGGRRPRPSPARRRPVERSGAASRTSSRSEGPGRPEPSGPVAPVRRRSAGTRSARGRHKRWRHPRCHRWCRPGRRTPPIPRRACPRHAR